MNAIKKYSGIIWILMGPLAIWWLIKTALIQVAKNPIIDTKIQWGIFVIVFIPIAIGIVIFGWYALKGEYDHLPESSEEL